MGNKTEATKIVNPNVVDLERIASANWKNDYLARNGKAIKRGCLGGRIFQAIFCCSKSCPAPDQLHRSQAIAAIVGKITAVTADSSVPPAEAIRLIARVSNSLDALAAKANTSRRAVLGNTQVHLLDVDTLCASSRAKIAAAEQAEAARQAQELAVAEAALKAEAAKKEAEEAAAKAAAARATDAGSSSDDEAPGAPRAGSPLRTSSHAMALARTLVEGFQAKEEGMVLRNKRVIYHRTDLSRLHFHM